jgi:ABC-2 type transport system ATP-binding protein
MSIIVENLTKKYGSQEAVSSVSFQIDAGEIVGLLGPNGAGKTTTMKILSGFIDLFEGAVSISGLNVRTHSFELKKRIGYLPEHNPLYLDMYVKEYLAFIASIFKLRNVRVRVAEMIEMTGLGREQNKLIGTLSKGYRQRVGLAQALIHDPEILILDEPTTGLDPNQLIEIRHLIKTLGSEKTVIFSSHIMQEVQALCDRVLIMHEGVLVANDRIEYLDQMINNQLEIRIELDRPLGVEWKIEQLVKSEVFNGKCYRLLFKKNKKDPRIEIFDFIVKNDRKIVSMTEKKSSMEDVFQKITMG